MSRVYGFWVQGFGSNWVLTDVRYKLPKSPCADIHKKPPTRDMSI